MLNQFSRYEEEFQQWVKGGYPGAKDGTVKYIRHLSDPEDDTRPREGALWPHQWDSFLRVVYSYEVRREELSRPNGVLLNVVTGGGKTAIIAAVIAWLKIAHDVQRFLMLCPNLIVRDRLEEDFQDGKVFADRGLIPEGATVTKDDFALTTLGSNRPGGWASLLGANVILGNIHQFYASNASGRSNLSGMLKDRDFALFNDEAHNSPADEWDATLEKMRPKTILRVDTTATPDRADGRAPESKMIYEYLIQDALAERLVKTPVVYQPNIKTVELTYTDARTGETRGVEEIDWAEVDRLGLNATQWVTDDKPMQQQMAIALQRVSEQEKRAKGRYQPILFVVAVCKVDAQKAARTLSNHFKVKTLLVTEDSPDADRSKATQLGKAQRGRAPYKAVVSVLMLREGWDVPEVGVILLLRKFGSPVYGQQVIGRGLRRVRKNGMEGSDRQICAIVDHPKLEHQWLWDIFSSKVRSNVGVGETFDEEEDLPDPPPRQELARPEKMIDIPEPSEEDDGGFVICCVEERPAEPLKNWYERLEGLEYPTEMVVITDQEITAVERTELTGEGWEIRESPPDYEPGPRVDLTHEEMAEGAKEELLNIAERLLDYAGFSRQYKGRIYGILLEHVRMKFLDGSSLGMAETPHLKSAIRMLSKVEERIKNMPGLVEGMVKYGD